MLDSEMGSLHYGCPTINWVTGLSSLFTCIDPQLAEQLSLKRAFGIVNPAQRTPAHPRPDGHVFNQLQANVKPAAFRNRRGLHFDLQELNSIR